jgi:PleD family two-component response regulator
MTDDHTIALDCEITKRYFVGRQKKVDEASNSSNVIAPGMHSTSDSGTTDSNVFRLQPLASALVVDGALINSLSTVSVLTNNHFRVTVADTFERAKERLNERAPVLLVTELRLREYNGLQLVLRGKSRRPNMAALVLTSVVDSVLQAEAEAMGATFIVTPIDSRELAAAAVRTVLRNTSVAADLEPIRPPFERRLRERRVSDVSPDIERRRADRRADLAALIALVADY